MKKFTAKTLEEKIKSINPNYTFYLSDMDGVLKGNIVNNDVTLRLHISGKPESPYGFLRKQGNRTEWPIVWANTQDEFVEEITKLLEDTYYEEGKL